MKNQVFLPFATLVFAGFLVLHFHLHNHFNGVAELKLKNSILKEEKNRSELKALLSQYQLKDYQQNIATLMPEALRGQLPGPDNYVLRSLASVVTTADGDKLNIERAGQLIEKGKLAFREKDYELANSLFSKIINDYPNSIHVIEAYFLLTEGLYQIKEYEICIDAIEAMINVFPESELSGFAMLRLGKIYEVQERIEDAAEIYKTVLSTYPQESIQDQAKQNLKAVQ